MAPQQGGGQVAEDTPNGSKVRIGIVSEVSPRSSVLTCFHISICSLGESSIL